MSLITFNKETALFNRTCDLQVKTSALKAFGAIGIAMVLGAGASAQCDNFKLNAGSNPMKGLVVASGMESRPFFIDIDGDGDLDCFSGEYNSKYNIQSKIYFFRNDGTNVHPSFKKTTGTGNPLDKVATPTLSIPYFVDIDADGDFDCFIGDGSDGAIRFYKNEGTATNPVFEKQSAALNPLSMVKLSAQFLAEPAFADLDGDGDFDCLVTDLYGEANYYRNTGTAKEPFFEHITGAANPFGFIKDLQGNVPSFYDWNKDGLTDLFLGTKYYKNSGTKTEPSFVLSEIDGPKFATGSYLLPLRWVNLSSKNSVTVITGTAAGTFNFHTTAPEISITPKDNQTIAKGASVTLRVSPNIAGYSYQWLKDGNPVNGAVKNELTVKNPGAYSVEVKGTCAEISTNATSVILKGQANSIAAAESDAASALLQVQAYPNPSKDEFMIQLPANLKAGTNLRIMDLQGRMLQALKASGSSMKFGKELLSGIYFLQIYEGDKLIHQQKIIKE